VALRWRGGTTHSLPFVVLVLLQVERVGSLSGYRGGVHGGSFDRRDNLECANPTLEQRARHWFYYFRTNPVLSHLFTHVLVFYFRCET
jgi:hypothetical protein